MLVRIAAFALVAATLSACSWLVRPPSVHEVVPDDRLDAPLSADDVETDLRFAIERIEEVHPDPYAHTPKERIEAELASILAEPTPPMTRRKLNRRLARLLARPGARRVQTPRVRGARRARRRCNGRRRAFGP